MDKKNKDNFSPESRVIAGGHDPQSVLNSIKNPIFQTSTFKFNTAEEGKAFFNDYKDADTLEELEDLLITSDLGVATAARICAELARDRYDKEISAEEVREVLASEVTKIP